MSGTPRLVTFWTEEHRYCFKDGGRVGLQRRGRLWRPVPRFAPGQRGPSASSRKRALLADSAADSPYAPLSSVKNVDSAEKQGVTVDFAGGEAHKPATMTAETS